MEKTRDFITQDTGTEQTWRWKIVAVRRAMRILVSRLSHIEVGTLVETADAGMLPEFGFDEIHTEAGSV
jgi:hypothetical protein